MLTFAGIVSDPPRQPYVPSARLRALPGVSAWWATQEGMSYLDAGGYRAIRATVGSRPLVARLASSATPMLFRDKSVSGRRFRPSGAAFVPGQPTNTWSAPVSLVAGWNSFAVICRPELTANTSVVLQIPLNSGKSLRFAPLNGGAAGVFTSGTGGTNTNFSGAVTNLNEASLIAVAFNTETGDVKIAKNNGSVLSAVNTGLVGTALDPVSDLSFGGRASMAVMDGDWFDLGLFLGSDVLASASARAALATYAQQVYGIF